MLSPAQRVRSQEIIELAPAGADGVFVMYQYELTTGERHRNTEFTVVRDGKLVETHVFFGRPVRLTAGCARAPY